MTAAPLTAEDTSTVSYSYEQVHRAGRRGIWRPLVGVAAMAAITYAVAPLVMQFALALWLGMTGQPISSEMDRILDLSNPTPAGLAVVNLILASAILTTWLITRVLHGLKPRWLASVQPRIRWRFLVICLGLSVAALIPALLASSLVAGTDTGADTVTGVNEFTASARNFTLVVLLLTPLQAAGEEYFFRGYLTQAVGGLLGRTAAVVIPALLFALAHGAQSPPVFIDRLAFGVIAGILVIRTGGLEAGIAMHVINNWLAFGLAIAFGDMGATLNPGEGRWVDLIPTLVQAGLYLFLALIVARRLHLKTRADGSALRAELVASSGRVYRFASAQPPPNERE